MKMIHFPHCNQLEWYWSIVDLLLERRRVREEEYPLLLRVTLGPDESSAKLFLVEREGEDSHEISAAVAQFIHLSDAECNSILRLFSEEEEREVQLIRNKYCIKWLFNNLNSFLKKLLLFLFHCH